MLLESKKNFVRYVSHEVRTPLNIVFMGLQFLTSEEFTTENTVNEDTRTLLRETLDACGMAISILNELLLYDKVEDGQLVLEKESVVVAQMLHDVIAPFRAQAAEKQVSLFFKEEDHLPQILSITGVCVDVNKFSQVIRNLVSNAIKFSPPGFDVHVYAFLTEQQVSFIITATISLIC
jgi:signal transduction histidine kinase